MPEVEKLTHLKIVLLVSAKAVYNIYLHPLRRFPGSKLWALSPVPVALAQLRGTLHDFTHSAHQRYGTVVRISPNELSFISAAAWGDIYNRREGKSPLPRDKAFFNDMLVDRNTLTMADDHNHARLRRAMNPAFSPRALASLPALFGRPSELHWQEVSSSVPDRQWRDLTELSGEGLRTIASRSFLPG
jgi:cytochrome P450